MTGLDTEVRTATNGTICHDHYRQRAAEMRRAARSRLLIAAFRALRTYFRLPQKRWMRVQASSRSDVLVAYEMRNAGPSPNAVP